MAGNEKGAGLSQRLYKRKGPTAEAVGPTTHVLTVAVWDRAKSPLVVWYFYGEEWTGTLRGNKAADRRDLRVEWVEPAQHGGSLRYREVSIMQEEERLLREYFGCTDKISPMELIYKAQNARSRRLRSERNQRQAEETRQYMNRLPPLPGDFEKRILKSCSDAVFLWFKNRKVKRVKGKPLEKYEKEFVREHPDLVNITSQLTAEEEEFFKRLGV